MLGKLGSLVRGAANAYIEDNCLSRGAAIAYYTVFALAPVLLIVIAVAGVVFGSEQARAALVAQIDYVMGQQGADAVQSILEGAAHRGSGVVATVIGVVTLIFAASGVFGEMQAALNTIWKTRPRQDAIWALIRARLISLALVVALGGLLMVSLILSAALAAVGDWVTAVLPEASWVLRPVNAGLSFVLIAALFGAIYKVLPDTDVAWRDVAVGALITATLMAIGKYAIALYIGSSSIATTYGAAGALAVLFVWIYYCSQILLFGAELTRCYATTFGSWRDGAPVAPKKGHAREIEGLKARLSGSRAATSA